jgi:O-antigen/teichoic acid export membrane protein
LLGAKWLEATPLIEMLAFNGALLVFHSSICAMLIARGFPRQVVVSNAIYVAVLLLGLTWTVPRLGATGAVYAVLTATLLATPVYLFHVQRRLGIAPTIFLRAVSRPALASAAMIAVVRGALPAHEVALPPSLAAAYLVAGVALGVLSYVPAELLLWQIAGRPPGPERLALMWAREMLAYLAARRMRGAS